MGKANELLIPALILSPVDWRSLVLPVVESSDKLGVNWIAVVRAGAEFWSSTPVDARAGTSPSIAVSITRKIAPLRQAALRLCGLKPRLSNLRSSLGALHGFKRWGLHGILL